MDPVQPILLLPQFRAIQAELLTLLRSLSPEDWDRPTVCKDWRVRDIAAHLLDGDLRRLMMCRDGIWPFAPPTDLPAFINRLNTEWVDVARRRLSARLLTSLLDFVNEEAMLFWEARDPFAPACFAVSWAGQQQSQNWFDLAREYTEKWHHQQQIREAVGAPGLVEAYWLRPALDTFVRALPVAFASVEGDQIAFRISGEAGGDWTLVRTGSGWQLMAGIDAEPSLTTDQDTAWRIFTKGLSPQEALPRVKGDRRLAGILVSARGIVA